VTFYLCVWCGYRSDRHRWDVESGDRECFDPVKCDERRHERAVELEALGNQGAVS